MTKNVYGVYVAGERFEVGFDWNSSRISLVDTIAGAGALLPAELEQNYMYLAVDNEMYKSCQDTTSIANVLQKELAKAPISSATENALSKLSDMIDKSALTVAANERKLT